MPESIPPEEIPVRINMRPAAFQRRFIASDTNDPNTLVALACDESYFVRRQAVQNPHTPRWILELLVRAGATPDLRGRGSIDPDLSSAELRRLVEAGPWAQQLVAEHPNTSAEVLAVLKDQPSLPLRQAVASHINVDRETLAVLCCSIEEEVRAIAVTNPRCSSEFITLLIAAGAAPKLQGVTRLWKTLNKEQLSYLALLGPWGRFLVARHPDSSESLLEAISQDPDWRVRSGLLDNPNTPTNIIQEMLKITNSEDLGAILLLSQLIVDEESLSSLAENDNPEVRMSVARHPAATVAILGWLATDDRKEIRKLTVGNPKTDAKYLMRLVQAGSTLDLVSFGEPDPTLPVTEIATLLDDGIWARLLAVRHPNTDAGTLAHLLCDREPKIREWAAVHPNLLPQSKRNLIRAGSGTDFQGIMPPDPELPTEVLWQINALGPWGSWVVANNPNAPAELLDLLAKSDDWQVRLFVAKNPNASSMSLIRLMMDEVTTVRQTAKEQIQVG